MRNHNASAYLRSSVFQRCLVDIRETAVGLNTEY